MLVQMQKRDELLQAKEEKEKDKKGLNKELSKIKKAMREKEKEIAKLKTDVLAAKKTEAGASKGES